MKLLQWDFDAWEDYLYWQVENKKNLKRINQLIKDIERHPFEGIGKPEPLKGNLTGLMKLFIKNTPLHITDLYLHQKT